jgi:hypothetical protein
MIGISFLMPAMLGGAALGGLTVMVVAIAAELRSLVN